MKKIGIIAGPNGAGKTTFAEEFLPNEGDCIEFVNADLIAAGLSPFQPERAALAAGRFMLQRIKELAARGKSFSFETTLSSRNYLRMIPRWRRAGYRVKLCFLKLPNADLAIHRVKQRVLLGGHNIPDDTIRRRYLRGLDNLRNFYLQAVDEWSIYDSLHISPLLLDSGTNIPPGSVMEDSPDYQSDAKHDQSDNELIMSDFIRGAEAALKRASDKAIARARQAGLEPIIWNNSTGEKNPWTDENPEAERTD